MPTSPVASPGWQHPISPFWVLQLSGWGAFGLLWYLASIPTYQIVGASTSEAIIRVSIFAGLGFGLTLLMRLFYRALWNRSYPFARLVLAALLSSLAASVIWFLFFEGVKWPLNQPAFSGKPWYLFARPLVSDAFILLAWSMLYFGIKYWQRSQQDRERALRAEALAHQAQYQMLRYQLNPHFFFNALNSIRAMIEENPGRAREMVTQFSEFIRYALLDSNVKTLALRDELDIVQDYLAIEKIRFEEQLVVVVEVDDAAETFPIPPFLIHPLVENAIKHGSPPRNAPLRLKLHAHMHKGRLQITVSNTGCLHRPASAEPIHTPIGLQNVRSRLEQAFPQRHRFSLYEEDGWVHALIEVYAPETEVPVPAGPSPVARTADPIL